MTWAQTIRWALFGLALAGLGYFLEATLLVDARATIRGEGLSVVALWPNGKVLATLTFEGRPPAVSFEGRPLQIWDTISGQRLASYLTNAGVLCDSDNVTFSKDRRFFAGFTPVDLEESRSRWRSGRAPVGNQVELTLVDLIAGREWSGILRTEKTLGRPEFSPKGNFVLARGRGADGAPEINLVECVSGRVVAQIPDWGNHAFTPDDARLLFSEAKPPYSLNFWDAKTRKVFRPKHEIPVGWLVAPDGRTLLASLDKGRGRVVGKGELVLWDLTDFRHRILGVYTEPVYDAVFSPNSRCLAIRVTDRLELWDTPTGKQGAVLSVDLGAAGGKNIVFSPDSRLIAAFPVPHVSQADPGVTDDEAFMIWDVATGAKLWEKHAEPGNLRWPTFTPHAGFLIDEKISPGRLDVLDAASGKTLRTIQVAGTRQGGADPPIGPRGKAAPTAWEMRQPEYFGPPSITPDGRWLTLISTISGRKPSVWEKWLGEWWPFPTEEWTTVVALVELETGRELFRREGQALLYALLSDDGRTLVTEEEGEGAQERVIRCWDVPSHPPLRETVGIPLGVGILMVLTKWWWRRRKYKAQPNSPMPNNATTGHVG